MVLPGIHLMSLAGPLDVFLRASAVLSRAGKRRSPAYEVELLTADETALPMGAGLFLTGGSHWTEVHHPIDTLLVLANAGIVQSPINPELLAWIRVRANDVRRVGSVCAGAFVLAAAGVLDGHQATTHWELSGHLAGRYPQISVDGDRIFTQDGNIWTSAGVSAGVDLALAMVEEDHGHALALEIARRMVLFMRRGSGQSQFSSQLAAQAADHQPIRELIAWISEHLDADLSVPALARRVGMSDRNFSRVFTQQVSMTPARFVARLRTEAARAKLAASGQKLETIAQISGFGDGETLRRHLRAEMERSARPVMGATLTTQ
ncbi:MAG TPA: helix-turn-helix domain-containing protein [Candidatus Binatia bacterium]|nr:helix-turn-helix domain-containing protein [Candidatus Binatia bacterium]